MGTSRTAVTPQTTNPPQTATTPQQLRHTNMEAVLAVMRRCGAVTGSDLIEATGLARATVIAVCGDLMTAGWVRELPTHKPAGVGHKGRPARVFEFDAGAGAVVGIDIGVAKTTALVADLRGAVLAQATEPFDAPDSPAAQRLDTVDRAVAAALAEAGAPASRVLAAGVGLAAPVDRDGTIAKGHAMWQRFDIGVQQELQLRHGWPVLAGNDANLAALAEGWVGVGAGVPDLAVMLAGERIGFGLLESGRLLHGASGRAGEVGLLELVDGVGSPDGIAHLARELAGRELAGQGLAGRPGRELAGLELAGQERVAGDPGAGAPAGPSAEQVFAAAAGGDPAARRILDVIARRLGRVIALMATFTDPELVVIGGAVAAPSAVLLGVLREELARFMPNPPRVEVSALGDSIVPLGAVRLALDHVEAGLLTRTPGGGAAQA